MSNLTPQIYAPDGTLSTSLIFTTNQASRFLTGTVSENVVDLQVSIRGGAYTNSTDWILFDGTGFTIPNPAAYPDGLDLQPGSDNDVDIKSVSTTGAVSSPATVQITYVQSGQLGTVITPPNQITLEQGDRSVTVNVTGLTDDNFVGINFYASTEAGGGATGYTRINVRAVNSYTATEATTDIGEFDTEALVKLDPATGLPEADPQYVTYTGTQTDSDGNILQSDFTDTLSIPESATRIRTTVSLQSVSVSNTYSFEHNRSNGPKSVPATISVNAFTSLLAPTEDLYYVATAVYYDPVSLTEQESGFSSEVVGHPLTVTATVANYPVVSRQQIVRSTIESIFRSNPHVKVEPGSFMRDVFIDPFSSEAERIRFIVDFTHRASSFPGLLQIDDPNQTGTSLAVSQSAYKQALKMAFYLASDSATQDIIDRAFESLAANVGVYRKPGQAARGEVTFYTTKKPTATFPIPVGSTASGGSVSFRVTQGSSIPVSQLAQYYNPSTGRYSVTVAVQATATGSAGNIAKGQVRKSGITGLNVTNSGDMFGGQEQWSNLKLATEARNALASVDSGTEQGIKQTIAGIAGVEQAVIVAAGNDLMYRDVDTTGVHTGGKVDVWVKPASTGTSEATDTFAFGYDIVKDVHFVLLGNPDSLIFQAIDPNLSAETPILNLLDDPTAGYVFRNATTGETFDLTGYDQLSFDTVQLAGEALGSDVVQPAVSLTDVVLGSYRRQTESSFIMTRQPVQSIVSVVGTVTGTLPTTTYSLYRMEDPLQKGRSSSASDYLKIVPVGGVPAGGTLTVLNESHVLVGVYPEYLDNLGANPLSIVVKSTDLLTTYSPNVDYTVTLPTDTTSPISLTRLTTGSITTGQTVYVSYEYQENFTVLYQTSNTVSVAQQVINSKKHVTADVLVKEAIPVPVSLTATVLLKQGAQVSTVDTAVRTNLTNFFNSLSLGEPARQSDLVSVIESTTGVSFVEVPFTLLAPAPGSLIVQESVANTATYLPTLSSPTVSVWVLSTPLTWVPDTSNSTQFTGTLQNTTLLTSATTSTIGLGAGRAVIVSTDLGITDITTVNRVLVSTTVDQNPSSYSYVTTYITGMGTGAQNMDPGSASYLTLNTKLGAVLDLTYDEDRG